MKQAQHKFIAMKQSFKALRDDTSGLALIEFAAALPFLLLISLTGAELTNYATTKMRVSQVALHLADHISRVGVGSLLTAKQVHEVDINDALTGAGLQGGGIDLYQNGRVIISSVEGETAPVNTSGEYKIAWQRCRGLKNYTSSYGNQGDEDLDGVGPTGRKVVAPDNGAVIFVEVSYDYQPLFKADLVPSTQIVEIAAMTVRDTRDLTQVYNTAGVTQANCAVFSAT